ncbi:MAG: antibiotic biosynthesis monooxygenase, partial [Pseudomonadota bacterium]
MILVIFEVWPTHEGHGEYLDIAAALKPLAESVPGFVSIERFQSLTDGEKLLSLSVWESEEAISRW